MIWTGSGTGGCAGWANGTSWWCWAISALCGTAAQKNRKSWTGCESGPYTLLFLDGSHENYDLLAQYPETERFGGRVQSLGGNVYHVCRGSVLELEDKKYLCFGGAESPDREEREPGVNWWKQEMPSDEEYAACEQNLEACGDQVDYVLTHDAPSRFLDFTVLASGETNQLHQFLDKILLKLTYEKWFFGCYHRDVQLSTKSRCVFCDVIPMGERRTGLFRR
ncbi:MAG: calcineurin-like phosphoesterase [Faecalibacterium sp.]